MHSPSSEPRASVFYTYKVHPYRHSPDMDSGRAGAPVVIVGAGPIGLATAIDLSRFGVASILLDEDLQVSHGSRAIVLTRGTRLPWPRRRDRSPRRSSHTPPRAPSSFPACRSS